MYDRDTVIRESASIRLDLQPVLDAPDLRQRTYAEEQLRARLVVLASRHQRAGGRDMHGDPDGDAAVRALAAWDGPGDLTVPEDSAVMPLRIAGTVVRCPRDLVSRVGFTIYRTTETTETTARIYADASGNYYYEQRREALVVALSEGLVHEGACRRAVALISEHAHASLVATETKATAEANRKAAGMELAAERLRQK